MIDELLGQIRKVVHEGDIVLTLGRGNENLIGRINESGIEVTTDHSLSHQGGSVLAPARMFNDVWGELRTRPSVSRDEVDRTRRGGRSSGPPSSSRSSRSCPRWPSRRPDRSR